MVKISDDQLDCLKEIVNIGVGQAAASLNEMLDAPIELDVPSITVFTRQDFEKGVDGLASQHLACVKLGFMGAFDGQAALVFPPESAAKLVDALTGEESVVPYLDAVRVETLNEIGNIVINCVMGSISNILVKSLDFALPSYIEGSLGDLVGIDNNTEEVSILLVRTRFRVQELQIEGNIFLIFELDAFDKLVKAIDGIYSNS